MTDHPIDTEEARFGAEAHLRYGGGGDDLAENVLALLDALAAAEHRATRAEAQAEARRINGEYWKETALQERAAALDALDQIKTRDQRIKAVRDVLRSHRAYDGARTLTHRIRRALDAPTTPEETA